MSYNPRFMTSPVMCLDSIQANAKNYDHAIELLCHDNQFTQYDIVFITRIFTGEMENDLTVSTKRLIDLAILHDIDGKIKLTPLGFIFKNRLLKIEKEFEARRQSTVWFKLMVFITSLRRPQRKDMTQSFIDDFSNNYRSIENKVLEILTCDARLVYNPPIDVEENPLLVEYKTYMTGLYTKHPSAFWLHPDGPLFEDTHV